MTAPIDSILLLAKLDAPSRAMRFSQIDRFIFALPRQPCIWIADRQRGAHATAQSTLT